MIIMNLKLLRSIVSVTSLMAMIACLMAGCTSVPQRTDLNPLPKPIPDAQHLKVKPGETPQLSFKHAFDTSAPHTGGN